MAAVYKYCKPSKFKVKWARLRVDWTEPVNRTEPLSTDSLVTEPVNRWTALNRTEPNRTGEPNRWTDQKINIFRGYAIIFLHISVTVNSVSDSSEDGGLLPMWFSAPCNNFDFFLFKIFLRTMLPLKLRAKSQTILDANAGHDHASQKTWQITSFIATIQVLKNRIHFLLLSRSTFDSHSLSIFIFKINKKESQKTGTKVFIWKRNCSYGP